MFQKILQLITLKKTIKEVINFFSVDFIDKNDILDIYKYLAERT